MYLPFHSYNPFKFHPEYLTFSLPIFLGIASLLPSSYYSLSPEPYLNFSSPTLSTEMSLEYTQLSCHSRRIFSKKETIKYFYSLPAYILPVNTCPFAVLWPWGGFVWQVEPRLKPGEGDPPCHHSLEYPIRKW